MARPLRIQEPGVWHHVMNRGMERRAIFIDEEDAETFLGLVGDAGERWGVWCHAACLMSTHYHLLLHDERGLLSRAMRHVDGVFTQFFNRRRGRDGTLMRGRYRSRIVEEEGYLLEVVRYIHSNPVKAGIVERASDYEWSSHGWYLERKGPRWLRREEVLSRFGSGAKGRAAFDEFVHERIPKQVYSVLNSKRWGPVLGSEEFVGAWKERIRESKEYGNPEIAEARRAGALTMEEAVKAAMKVFGCRRARLLRGVRGSQNRERELTMLVCREYTPVRNAELGRKFGVGAASVSTAVRRTRESVSKEGQMRRDYENLVTTLQNKSQASS